MLNLDRNWLWKTIFRSKTLQEPPSEPLSYQVSFITGIVSALEKPVWNQLFGILRWSDRFLVDFCIPNSPNRLCRSRNVSHIEWNHHVVLSRPATQKIHNAPCRPKDHHRRAVVSSESATVFEEWDDNDGKLDAAALKSQRSFSVPKLILSASKPFSNFASFVACCLCMGSNDKRNLAHPLDHQEAPANERNRRPVQHVVFGVDLGIVSSPQRSKSSKNMFSTRQESAARLRRDRYCIHLRERNQPSFLWFCVFHRAEGVWHFEMINSNEKRDGCSTWWSFRSRHWVHSSRVVPGLLLLSHTSH